MATFPPRLEQLQHSLPSIARQVDRVDLILNEYPEIPAFLAGFANVNPIIPVQDTKDAGKFLPAAKDDDLVFLADDDLLYAPEYVQVFLDEGTRLGLQNHVLGLHGTLYKRRLKSLRSRSRFPYAKRLKKSIVVDQLGTGTVMVKGGNMPSFAQMNKAQKFVDVRFASLCRQAGLSLVAIARPSRLAVTIHGDGQSIYESFTRTSPDHVLQEVRSFAGQDPLLHKKI
ncbi:MAG TPA: hypothetical protein ENK28_10215 [Aliiroseovarius sp.]|nr:hypothetical protein [Aliiroseovarius sp.]